MEVHNVLKYPIHPSPIDLANPSYLGKQGMMYLPMVQGVWSGCLALQQINQIYTPLERPTIQYTKNSWKRIQDCPAPNTHF